MSHPPFAMEETEPVSPSVEAFQRLWAAVIEIQVRDALRSKRLHSWGFTIAKRDSAIYWLLNETRDFAMVCDMAGLNPDAVRMQMRQVLTA